MNYQILAEFCLGGLNWSPKIFWQKANLQDIAYAIGGYCKYQLGIDKANTPPEANFLEKMLKKFPDQV